MTKDIAQALTLLVAQNLKAGVVGKAFRYSSLAYAIRPADREVNEVHAYACLLSGKPETAKEIAEAWQAEGRAATHNLLMIKHYAELRLGLIEEAGATLQALLQLPRLRLPNPPTSARPETGRVSRP